MNYNWLLMNYELNIIYCIGTPEICIIPHNQGQGLETHNTLPFVSSVQLTLCSFQTRSYLLVSSPVHSIFGGDDFGNLEPYRFLREHAAIIIDMCIMYITKCSL